MPAAPPAGSFPPSLTATAYADLLLRTLGVRAARPPQAPEEHPAVAWAGSGMMMLTGLPQAGPLMCPAPLASCADGALAALASLAAPGALEGLRGSQLLAERAALMGLRRAGAVSPGGACRLYDTADGGIALNLARDEDRELLAAWLELAATPDAASLPGLIAARPVRELVERGRLLGLAVSADRVPVPGPVAWFTVMALGPKREIEPKRPPRVLDLSSLWAGPLCAQLLHRLGAEVIKLESPQRPDGARRGNPAFFDLLNAGKRSVVIDPRSAAGLAQWRRLIASADIVIEGSRPRGLRQLGIDAETVLGQRPGLTWLGICGYGRGEPEENWVAYGDDAAVAAGLSGLMHQASGEHLICGDAIADPLTGLHAALAAWASYREGGGRLIAMALCDVVAHCLGFDRPDSPDALRRRQREWSAIAAAHGIGEPRARAPARAARPPGADTEAVLRELAAAC